MSRWKGGGVVLGVVVALGVLRGFCQGLGVAFRVTLQVVVQSGVAGEVALRVMTELWGCLRVVSRVAWQSRGCAGGSGIGVVCRNNYI